MEKEEGTPGVKGNGWEGTTEEVCVVRRKMWMEEILMRFQQQGRWRGRSKKEGQRRVNVVGIDMMKDL